VEDETRTNEIRRLVAGTPARAELPGSSHIEKIRRKGTFFSSLLKRSLLISITQTNRPASILLATESKNTPHERAPTMCKNTALSTGELATHVQRTRSRSGRWVIVKTSQSVVSEMANAAALAKATNGDANT